MFSTVSLCAVPVTPPPSSTAAPPYLGVCASGSASASAVPAAPAPTTTITTLTAATAAAAAVCALATISTAAAAAATVTAATSAPADAAPATDATTTAAAASPSAAPPPDAAAPTATVASLAATATTTATAAVAAATTASIVCDPVVGDSCGSRSASFLTASASSVTLSTTLVVRKFKCAFEYRQCDYDYRLLYGHLGPGSDSADLLGDLVLLFRRMLYCIIMLPPPSWRPTHAFADVRIGEAAVPGPPPGGSPGGAAGGAPEGDAPPPALDIDIKGASWNVGGTLANEALVLAAYMDARGLDVMFISDSGHVDLLAVRKALFPRQVYATVPGPRSCAIILSPDLHKVGEPLVDPSGGALAVDLLAPGRQEGANKVVRMISVYQPPGLDGVATRRWQDSPLVGDLRDVPVSGTLSGPLLRAEAHRVRTVVRDWSRAPGVKLTVCSGDLNETVNGPVDRLVGPSGVRRGQQLFGCIHHMLLVDGFSDLYGDLHPVREDSGTDGPSLGHTMYGNHTTGSSRLQYVMVHPRPDYDSVGRIYCHPDDGLFLSEGRDPEFGHRPILFGLPAGLLRKGRPGSAPKRWMNASVRLADLSDLQVSALFTSVSQAVLPLQEGWCASLDGAEVSCACACECAGVCLCVCSCGGEVAGVIGGISEEFGKALLGGASSVTSVRRAGVQKAHRPSPSATRAKSTLRQVGRLVRSLRCSFDEGGSPSTLFSRAAADARRELKRLGASSLLGACGEAGWGRVELWRTWLDRDSARVVENLKVELASIVRSSPGHPSNIKSTLFRTPEGRGKYYRFAKNGSSASVDSARDAAGTIHTSPGVYIPLVREAVSAPFARPRSGPAVPTWRPLSQSEKASGVPFWWDSMYDRSAKGIPCAVWGDLMVPVTPRELFDAIAKVPAGKAPGHDGVSIDLLKVVVGLLPGGDQSFRGSPSLEVLVSLVNATLRTGSCPDVHKLGIITLVPKPGSSCTDPSGMRPITLLPEVAKLLNRVITDRFTSVLHYHPSVMCAAQRAYLHDGSSRQCLHTVLNVCEDFCERIRRDPFHELVLTSYDVKKAFDSVQHFTIVATCRRFNLPESFIKLVVSSLRDAVSQVRTRDGLSAPFDVLTSVRQGDPLAAIIFVLVLDALHAGFARNPLAPDRRVGYEFAADGACPVASSGYADDTAVLSSSWEEAQLQHLWLLDFFTAHHLRLNSSKSYCVIGSGTGVSMDAACAVEKARKALERSVAPGSRARPGTREALRGVYEAALDSASTPGLRFLPDIEEGRVHDPANGSPAPDSLLANPVPLDNALIMTRPRSYAFRYLGLELRVDLRADEMVSVLNGRVWAACRSIRALDLDLVQSADYIREYLYPRLELGLAFSRVPRSVTKGWDSLIRRAVLSVHNGANVNGVASSALLLSLGVLSVTQHAVMVRSVEMGNVLRGDDPSSALSSVFRLKEALRVGSLATEDRVISGKRWRFVTTASASGTCRFAGAIRDLIDLGITVSSSVGLVDSVLPSDAPPAFDPRAGCKILDTGLSGLSRGSPSSDVSCPAGVCAFTDGSFTSPSMGGYAAILCRESSLSSPGFSFDGKWCVTLSGSSPLAGRNYSAECAAIAVALQAVPLNCPLRIYTDALSVMQSLSQGVLSASHRVRLGARPLIVSCRRLIALRADHGAPTEFVHVRSHTEGDGIGPRGNAAADVAADRAAAASRGCPAPPFLHNEERFVFWEGEGDGVRHVSGNLRDAIRSKLEAELLSAWSGKGTQGEVARRSGSQAVSLLRVVRKTRDPGLLLFLLLAMTRQLPTWDRLIFPKPHSPPLCHRCNKAPQSADHAFKCVAVRHVVRDMRAGVRRAVEALAGAARGPGSLAADHRFVLQNLDSLAWYDPTRPPSGTGLFPEMNLSAEVRSALGSIDGFDRYTGMLGVLPTSLRRIVCPDPSVTGARERTHRCLRAYSEKGLADLRLLLCRRAKDVFESWHGHPVSFVPFRSPAPPDRAPLWDHARRVWTRRYLGVGRAVGSGRAPVVQGFLLSHRRDPSPVSASAAASSDSGSGAGGVSMNEVVAAARAAATAAALKAVSRLSLGGFAAATQACVAAPETTSHAPWDQGVVCAGEGGPVGEAHNAPDVVSGLGGVSLGEVVAAARSAASAAALRDISRLFLGGGVDGASRGAASTRACVAAPDAASHAPMDQGVACTGGGGPVGESHDAPDGAPGLGSVSLGEVVDAARSAAGAAAMRDISRLSFGGSAGNAAPGSGPHGSPRPRPVGDGPHDVGVAPGGSTTSSSAGLLLGGISAASVPPGAQGLSGPPLPGGSARGPPGSRHVRHGGGPGMPHRSPGSRAVVGGYLRRGRPSHEEVRIAAVAAATAAASLVADLDVHASARPRPPPDD